MENKTISYLESKIWYRALKVFYVMLFAITFICYNTFIWIDVKNSSTKIHFTDGTTINFDGKPNQADIDEAYQHSISIKPIQKMTREEYQAKYGETVEQAQVRATQGQGLTGQQLMDAGAKPINSPDYTSQSNTSNIITMLAYFIVGNLLIILFFEFLRQAFYYIFLGKLKPQK